MKLLYKFMLTLNAIGLFLIVYFTKGNIWIFSFGKYSLIPYLFIIIIFAAICILFTYALPKDSIEGGIQDIETANDSYMASYLGYFFVALSIPDNDYITLVLVFGLIFIFTFFSQTLYYNPIFLLFGYKFYYLTNKHNIKIFIISRRDIRTTDGLKFEKLRRINDFTFIDKEKDK